MSKTKQILFLEPLKFRNSLQKTPDYSMEELLLLGILILNFLFKKFKLQMNMGRTSVAEIRYNY